MKIQPLYDLQQEINRLFIAGSKFAAGDPRLLKQVPVLNKLGEKAPIFKKLASEIEALTQTSSQESAEKLLSISTLLYSILYTQGETVEEGLESSEQVPSFPEEEIATGNTYLQLKPVITALTTSQQGRLEILVDAMEQKVFHDFRTWQHLDKALGDKYSELADLVAETIIPSIGAAILPFLVQRFAYEDKAEQVRRLRTLIRLNYEKLPEIAEKVLAENLPNLQAEAIRFLAKDTKNELLIHQLTDDKNKLVREAAYFALVQFNNEKSIGKIKDVYCTGKSNQGVVRALASSNTSLFFGEILAQFNKTLEKLLALDKNSKDKEITDQVGRVTMELEIFKNKDRPEVYALFEKIILDKNLNEMLTAKKALLSYNASGLPNSIVECLHTYDQKNVLDFYSRLMPQMKNADWQHEFHRQYFHASCAAKRPAEIIFDQFITAFEKEYININDLHYQVFGRGRSHYYSMEAHDEPDLTVLDKRWVPYLFAMVEQKTGQDKSPFALNITTLSILHVYEPHNNNRLNNILLELVKSKPAQEVEFLYAMIVERNIPNGFDVIFNSLNQAKKTSRYYYSNIGKAGFWKKFPKEYAMKIRDLHVRDGIAVFDEIADAIEFN